MKPVPRPLGRSPRIGRGCRGGSYFFLGDLAVAVLVEPQDEHARLFHELAARDLAVLVFVEIAKVRIRQGGISFFDRFELSRAETFVVVAIGRREQPVHKTLPFLAGVDAVVIGVPDRRPVVEHGVRPRSGLRKGERSGGQKSDRDAYPKNRFPVRHIFLLSLQPSAADDRGGALSRNRLTHSSMRARLYA